MLRTGKGRFSKVTNIPSFFKMANAMWKAPEEPFIFSSLNIDVSKALAWMKSHKERTGEKITINHLCTKALAMAYRKYPQVNAKIEGNKIFQRKTVDFQILVSTESGDELSGIKLEEVDKKSVSQISREIRDGAKAVRENRGPSYQFSKDLIGHCNIFLTRWIMKGASLLVNKLGIDLSLLGFPEDPFGSAIISCVGMHGIESAYGPLVPISRCGLLLVIPAITEKPWAEGGEVTVRPVLKLCMTLDHRLFHGYYVSLLHKELKRLLENPEALMGEMGKIRVLGDPVKTAAVVSSGKKVATGGV